MPLTENTVADNGNYLKLARSSKYSGFKKPLPSALNFTFGSTKDHDVSNPITALTKQSVDAIAIPASALNDAKSAGCTITSFEDTTWGLCFNTNNNLMKNSSIRKAFVQTLRSKKIVSHLPANSRTADDIITPTTSFMVRTTVSLPAAHFLQRQTIKWLPVFLTH